MQNDKLLYGVVGFLLGVVLTMLFANYAVNGNHSGMMRMMGIRGGYYGNMMDYR